MQPAIALERTICEFEDHREYFLTDEEERGRRRRVLQANKTEMCYAQEWQRATHSNVLGTYTDAPSSNCYWKQ